MIWIFISSITLLMGSEVNALVEHTKKMENLQKSRNKSTQK